MEYCSVGDLSQYIRRIRSHKATRGPAGGLPENVVRHFLKQLASALQFLRSQNLVHRDIKPQNLLLVLPQEHPNPRFRDSEIPILKVADFGFARFLPNASLADTLCGSPLYMGPEILSYKKYDAKADLWSVGAVLYEMITGRPPFRAQNHLDLLKKIQDNGDRIRFPDEKQPDPNSSRQEVIEIGADLKDLIRKLLKKEPAERISFEEFFLHPAVLGIQESPQDQEIYSPSRPGDNSDRETPYSQSPAVPSRSSSVSSRTPRSLDRPALVSKSRYDPASYEPPPFANPPNTPRQALERRRSSRIEDRNIPSNSPIDNAPSTSNVQSEVSTRPAGPEDGDEDVLLGYVVLNRKLIETNQFADDLDDRTHKGKNIPSPNSQQVTGAVPVTPPPIARERKISTGPRGSALTKAISMATERLFGFAHPPPNTNKLPLSRVGSPKGFLETNGTEGNRGMMTRIEQIACMAHAVACMADSKYEKLTKGFDANDNQMAEEAYVLHIKSLALLEQGLDTARQYWTRVSDEQARLVFSRLNEAVQWMRERFNECLDRASHEGSKIGDEEGGTFVQKLLYERALEKSRGAAVLELVGENLTKCEQDYQTAIWLLSAIMQHEEEGIVLEENDRRIINKFIDSIRIRISALRRKMERPAEDFIIERPRNTLK
ncbi:kinase-like domain-containing protein [Phycomyces nitens]|nr:kinase-like domain-containing protein [Phycomyces nitens]